MESVAEEISPLWQSSFCGFTDHPELTIQPFLMFLSFYLVALLGSPGKSTGVGCHCLLRLRNVEMLILTPGDTQLHTPWASSWAFFPCRMPATSWSSPLRSWPHLPQPNGHLLADVQPGSFSSPSSPSLTIFTTIFTISSLCLLSGMASDRFVAISDPLSCNVVTSLGLCLGVIEGHPVYCVPSASVMTIRSTSPSISHPDKARLQQHDAKWDCHPLFCQTHLPGQRRNRPGLLPAHHQNDSEGDVCWWESQDLLHLHLLSHCFCSLCDTCLPVPEK